MHFNLDASAPAVRESTISYVFKEGTTPKASSKDVLTFMGMPIDGTKEEVATKLEGVGFKRHHIEDYFTGIFNGESVEVRISTIL